MKVQDFKLRVGFFRRLSLVCLLACLAACSGGGDTDGGAALDNAEDFGDDHFVADENSVGGIKVEVNDSEIEVSRTSGFFATVFDANGNPVPNIKVSCDSEVGVAIIEPTTGTEITSSSGSISGRIGCEVAGSFQFACRVPVGANKRKFVDIKCSGETPNGFTGFPGAAGGGLGTGGVSDSEDGGTGGTDSSGVRITEILADDTGSGSFTSSIDTVQGTCTDGSAEPFFDTQFKVTVVNNSNSTVRFTKLSYSVDSATGAGTASFNSNDIALIGEASPNGGEEEFSGLLVFDAAGGSKFFHGSSVRIPTSLGFRIITVRISGTNDLGESVVVQGRTTLSFDNYGRCS